jgi:hypothetical protein
MSVVFYLVLRIWDALIFDVVFVISRGSVCSGFYSDCYIRGVLCFLLFMTSLTYTLRFPISFSLSFSHEKKSRSLYFAQQKSSSKKQIFGTRKLQDHFVVDISFSSLVLVLAV